jgi:hypothetical protein
MTGLVKGVGEAFSKSMEPFVSESIAPEALLTLLLEVGLQKKVKNYIRTIHLLKIE